MKEHGARIIKEKLTCLQLPLTTATARTKNTVQGIHGYQNRMCPRMVSRLGVAADVHVAGAVDGPTLGIHRGAHVDPAEHRVQRRGRTSRRGERPLLLFLFCCCRHWSSLLIWSPSKSA